MWGLTHCSGPKQLVQGQQPGLRLGRVLITHNKGSPGIGILVSLHNCQGSLAERQIPWSKCEGVQESSHLTFGNSEDHCSGHSESSLRFSSYHVLGFNSWFLTPVKKAQRDSLSYLC